MSASEQSGLAASEAETRLGLVAVQSIVVSCSMAVGLGWILGEHLLDVGDADEHPAIDLGRPQFFGLDHARDRFFVHPDELDQILIPKSVNAITPSSQRREPG